MFAKSPLLALALLILSASILEAAQSRYVHELRTGVPYYMIPAIQAIGGGVAPEKIGNEKCPSEVKLTQEVFRGVPITFSTSAYDSGENVVIDENTDVYISFNASVCEEQKTWGYHFTGPLQSEVTLVLTTLARIYVRPNFRLWKMGQLYTIFCPRGADSDGNVVNYVLIPSEDGHLTLRSEGPSIPYYFAEAKDNQDMTIKSVV